MKWVWVMPDPNDFPSGGNVYNRGLTGALGMCGEEVAIADWASWKRHALQWQPDWIVFDSLYLDELAQLHLEILLPITTRTLVLVHHLSSLENGNSGRLATEMATLAHFDGVLVTSTFTKDYLSSQGCPTPIWVLEPPFMPALATLEEAQRNLQPYLLMINNLIPRKGVLEYLRGLHRAYAQIPVHIVVAGSPLMDPDYADACKNEVDKSEVLQTRIHFLGAVDHREIRLWLEGAALLVSASSMETFGMAMQEALAAGVPVLALNGGHTERLIRDGIDGWVVPDMHALVEATGAWWDGHLSVPDEVKMDRVESSYEQVAEDLIALTQR